MKRAIALAGALALLPGLKAQHVFTVVDEEGRPQIVRAMNRMTPQVGDGEKLRGASGGRYSLMPAQVYGFGYISVAHLAVKTFHLELSDGAGSLNYEIHVFADLTSETDLRRCYLVLDLDFEGDKGFVFRELPDLQAGRPEHIEYVFPVIKGLDRGRYHLHFFSDGMEVISSQLIPIDRDRHRRKTEEFILRKQPDRPPVVIHAVPPDYPAELRSQPQPGSATILCRIDAAGKLVDATVTAASHPAFGEAALQAVRQWQFGAAIKDHHFIPKNVGIPFNFPLPDTPAK